MKLTHQRMTSRYANTPESLLDWLEEQLENRGIDAVVYTRYILSLLQEDDTDSEEDTNTNTNASTGLVLSQGICRKQNSKNSSLSCLKENIKPVTTTKWKHKRYLKQSVANNDNYNNNNCNTGAGGYHCCDYWPHSSISSDEERKLAVVQCLKSASEQEFGIESFVDELCAKLKKIKLLSETNEITIDCKTDSITNNNNNNNGLKVSPKEQAMKYFAAFPALDTSPMEGESRSKANSTAVVVKEVVNPKKDSNGNKWNGQKIIEFMCSGDRSSQQTLITTDNCSEKYEKSAKTESLAMFVEAMDKKSVSLEPRPKTELSDSQKSYFYCQDIESSVLSNGVCAETDVGVDSSLVVDIKTQINNNLVDSEESDIFQKLVNKFNSNIASIWAKTSLEETIVSNPKNDNIWSFDSSFSSNQSSATPSPKPTNAVDLWSSIATTDDKRSAAIVDDICSLPEMSWESSLLQSLNTFSDDGFIDGTEETNNNSDKQCNTLVSIDSNRISLENHEKNSPFIEFNTSVSSLSTTSTSAKTCSLELSKLLSMVSLLHNSKPSITPPDPTDENLLTSPKTHFQPIKHSSDSFEDRDESDEGSVADITDGEVKRLVICSDKCPNNGKDSKSFADKFGHKFRPLSTSLDELAFFMGPFNEFELTSGEFLSSLAISDEMEFKNSVKEENKMRDKSTNTEIEFYIEAKPTKLEPIIESTGENEPEYQDLCNMIDEVLRNGISDDDSSSSAIGCTTGLSLTNTTASALVSDDWYDSDFADNCIDLVVGDRNREKRLSWNYYWDTYDIGISSSSSEQFFAKHTLKSEIRSKRVIEDVSDQHLSEPEQHILDLNERIGTMTTTTTTTPFERWEAYDDVFTEGICFADSVDNCPQYDGLFDDDYCLPEGTDFDSDYINAVYGGSRLLGYASEDLSDGIASAFDGQPFCLQLKPRQTEAVQLRRHRKPCSFFIEGKCKRSDCKYSHDISAITCKYWEEGFCFKADLCPFLHGYALDDPDNIVNTSKISVLKSKNVFAIESESDFPSLSTLPNSEDNTSIALDSDSRRLEQQLFEFRTKSDNSRTTTTCVSKAKLPIAVFMKKKIKKRKDRNLQ